MFLAVPTPAEWSRRRVAQGQLLRSPEGEIEVLVLPIEGARIEPLNWLYQALLYRGGARPPIEWDEPVVTNVVQGQLTTAAAWTALTIEADVGGVHTLVAYFTFLDLSATVIAHSPLPVDMWREPIIEILYRAAPDFTPDRITCIAELLDAPAPTASAHVDFSMDGWRRAFSGGDVVLTRADDPDGGWIRQTANLGPTRSVPELFEEFETIEHGPQLGVTNEGEYFAIASGRTSSRTGDKRTTLAFVFGDTSYTRIESHCVGDKRAHAFAMAVLTLAQQVTFGYGAYRMRPYYYLPPRGWSALVRSGSTLWVSPACAHRYHVLRVFEAYPRDKADLMRRRRFETLASEFFIKPPLGPAVYYRPDNLEVRVLACSGTFGDTTLSVLDATVMDESYCYPFRIECDPRLFTDSMTLLEEVVKTIIPLPRPSPTVAPEAHSAFAEWAE